MKEYIVKGRLDNKTGFMSFTVKQELIRCKDCRYFRPDDDCDQCALWEYGKTDREAFCSYAMRRGKE